MIEFKNVWREELDQRHREALVAMLVSLETHYPSIWEKHFSRFSWTGFDDGRILKLSRLCLENLQHVI